MAIQNGGEFEFSRLEQRSIIQFMVIEKCKPGEIYRRMRDLYVEAMFLSNKSLQMGFLEPQSKKTVHGVKKFLGIVASKEGNANSVLEHERDHHYLFPWNRFNCKYCFLLPTLEVKYTLFIE